MKLIYWFVIASLLFPLGSALGQNTLKPVQKRAVLDLLRVYETNVNALVLKLVAKPGKQVTGITDFQKTLFASDKSKIYNHVAISNLQVDSTTASLMKQDLLSPQDFLQLCANVFRNNFSYTLNLDQTTIISPKTTADSSSSDIVKTRAAQVYVGVQVQGSNGALQIKQADSLRIDVEFTITSRRNVIPVRILRISKAVSGPKPPDIPTTLFVEGQKAKIKIDSLLNLITNLSIAKDTQAVQYKVYQRLLPSLVADEGRYHLRLGKDSTEQRIFATSFSRTDSLRHRKYLFEKALMARVTFDRSISDKPAVVTIEYFFGTTFRGKEMRYQKNYKVIEDTGQSRFSHPGWWIDEIWLKETVAKKMKPSSKDASPNK